MLDREIKVDKIDYIRVNDYQGGYIAGQHLIKSAYKHIIHLSGPAGLASAEGRKHGVLKSIEDADFDKENYRVIQGSYTEESGIRVMKKLLSDLEKMESCGIFAANDAMALGVLKVLNDHDIDCPGKVGLVGFDDINFSQYTNPPLTTINRPIAKIGNLAAEMILQRLKNKRCPYQNIQLDVKLVKRGSTK